MPDESDEPRGVNGLAVIIVLMVGAAVLTVIGFVVIQPPDNFEPAPASQRPFGPASQEDYDRRPLIDKGIDAKRNRQLNANRLGEPIEE